MELQWIFRQRETQVAIGSYYGAPTKTVCESEKILQYRNNPDDEWVDVQLNQHPIEDMKNES